MKRFLITLTFTLLAIISVSAQEKWRTLTFTGVSNAATQDQSFLPQFSASLDYELAEQFAVVSWNGFAYNTLNRSSWFASQTTLDKRINGFTIGIGYLYTTNAGSIFLPVVETGSNNEFYLSFKLQYRIKL